MVAGRDHEGLETRHHARMHQAGRSWNRREIVRFCDGANLARRLLAASDMSEDKPGKRPKHSSSVVLLRDLAPRHEVTGGASKVLFGERREPAKDTPKRSSAVKRNVD